MFIFNIQEKKIMKIGQYPSMADIAIAEIQDYRKILGDEQFKELSRAIGLISHGVGIGAFIYLRRIFESLIDDAHNIAKGKKGLDEKEYNKGRMEEKIKLLGKAYLPSFLVDNWQLYSILSKGIHELSEEDCLSSFPVVKGGIELILDEKIREKKRIEKEKTISVSIKGKHQELREKEKDK